MKKTPWLIIAVLSTLVGLYPAIYFFMDRRFGLLGSKSSALLSDTFWNITFYGHIIFGGLALLIGWLQFSKQLRKKKIKIHRGIGKMYVIFVLISGVCGLYIAYFATGGIISILGFSSLALIWLSTTILALKAVKNRKIALHEKLMIYSYAACFAAVTLRIWLPILIDLFGEFTNAYRLVAWLCWVPNMVVAYFIVNRNRGVPRVV